MDTLTYWNGTWHEGNPAILGPRDHAMWLGSIVFDGGRAFEGCGPDLDLHAERAVRSARSLGLNPKQSAEEILKHECPEIPNMRRAVDRRSAAVETKRVAIHRREFVQAAFQSVIQSEGHGG